MSHEAKHRLLRVVDHVGDLLEAQAAKMPPRQKVQAHILRNAAKIYRGIDNPKTVRIWEELPKLRIEQKTAQMVGTKNGHKVER
jgi:hypothetical protein